MNDAQVHKAAEHLAARRPGDHRFQTIRLKLQAYEQEIRDHLDRETAIDLARAPVPSLVATSTPEAVSPPPEPCSLVRCLSCDWAGPTDQMKIEPSMLDELIRVCPICAHGTFVVLS